jgi:hypothetical protein
MAQSAPNGSQFFHSFSPSRTSFVWGDEKKLSKQKNRELEREVGV